MMIDKQLKILHLISGLNTGGAEIMLYNLVSLLKQRGFKSEVVSMTDIGPVGQKIQNLDIKVSSLNMKRGWRGLLFCSAPWKFINLVKKYKPDIIQSWMYHANFLSGLSYPVIKNIPIVWAIHYTVYNIYDIYSPTRFVIRAGTKLSKIPEAIVFVSHESLKRHRELGYDNKNMTVIPNGFDKDMFKPDKESYYSVREELGLGPESYLIGNIARHHPMKDHPNFLKAFALVTKDFSNIHAVLAGDGIDQDNKELVRTINELGINKNIHLLGKRDDVPYLMPAFNVLTSSSSYGEACPGVLAEAMLCGVPCVVTDIGDSARIIGDTGVVVPARNPQALANGLKKIINIESKKKDDVGIKTRERIIQNYSLDKMADNYESIYKRV